MKQRRLNYRKRVIHDQNEATLAHSNHNNSTSCRWRRSHSTVLQLLKKFHHNILKRLKHALGDLNSPLDVQKMFLCGVRISKCIHVLLLSIAEPRGVASWNALTPHFEAELYHSSQQVFRFEQPLQSRAFAHAILSTRLKLACFNPPLNHKQLLVPPMN